MYSKLLSLLAVTIVATTLVVCAAPAESKAERLAGLLHVAPGMTVGEIGAGDGDLTVAMARIVGESGHVYANEVSNRRLERIRSSIEEAGLENVTVVTGEDTDAKLPAGCCYAIFMQTVYHHFTQPAEMNASLFRAMKPGGRLAVIDFPPRSGGVDGVPENRGGHGMPIDLLIEELERVGFRLEERIEAWRGREYCVVFSKGKSAGS